MDDRERLAWLALVWGADIGPAGFARLLETYGSATASLDVSPEELQQGAAKLRPQQAEAVPRVRKMLNFFGDEAHETTEAGVRVLLSTEPEYPGILRELSHPPPVVCLKGRLMPADALAVAIVGTRSPTFQGADMAAAMAVAAANEEFSVVSGLARGIDTAAHTAALGQDGRTIAVIGSGLRNITPPENEELAERVADFGAVLSELSPFAQPTIPNLMARNRLISLLSRGVIVVETGRTGGSLATAQAALQQGRKLYAVQWAERHGKTEGNDQLLALGAEGLRDARDLRWVCLELRAWVSPLAAPREGQAASAAPPQHQLSLF